MSEYPMEILNQGQMYISGRARDDRRVRIINQAGAQLFLGNGPSVLQQSSMRDTSTHVPGRKQLEYKKEGSIADIRKRSVVKITTASYEGSGSVWDTEGHITTNNHVADGNTLKVTLWDGSKHKADVVGRSRSQDLALLKLRGCDPSKLMPIEPSSKAVRTKDPVYTIGYPLHCDMTVTNGFISCLPRDPVGADIPEVRIRDAIQLDANINPGNSGGPLFDSKGRFIGVIVSCFPNTGIGYAIPLKTVTEMVYKFIQRDRDSKQLALVESLYIKTPPRHEQDRGAATSGMLSEASSSKRYELSTLKRTPPAGKAQPELVSYTKHEHLGVEVSKESKQVYYSSYEYSSYQYS